jgi:hypothetical protein
MIYQNFDLEIICPQGGDRLCARVLESPQGDCPFIDVKWPFDAETENLLLSEIYGGLRQRGRANKGSAVQDFGGKLFEAIFSGDIEHLFRSSLDTSYREGKGLRIRLRLPEDSELHMRPWEFLFDTESREFLAVREHTPLVRYLPVAQPIPPIMVEGPLRILVALSSPTDHPRLDIAREWEILCHALEPSITAGQLEMRRVPGRCTFDNLRDSLRHYGAHIFHFVGHGIPGALVLEQESGKGMEMEATHLRSAFPIGALPRLIVLNACSGAITEDVPFSGLAQGFLRQGVPAVVAMQASITDDAALIFTRYFYRDLIEIGAVDASLTEARLRMQANGHPIEWGTPVLYMRALNGQLFKPSAIPAATPERRKKPRETEAAASPLRVEPTLNERKKTKDIQAKQDAPPLQPETSPAERKKPRTARTRDNTPQRKPGPDTIEENFLSKSPVKGVTPPPTPGPDLAEQNFLSTVPAKEWTPPVKPEPDLPRQDIARKTQPTAFTPPAKPEPNPAGQAIPVKVEAEESASPPTPKPSPAEQIIPAKVQPRKHTPPLKPEPAGQVIARKDEVGESASPLTPEPAPAGQQVAPKVQARKHTPPPKQEPILDVHGIPSKVPATEPPPKFILEPELDKPAIPDDAGTPKPAPPAQGKAPARSPSGRRLLVYGSAAGLLAAALVVAISVDKIRPARENTVPVRTSASMPATTSASTARPAPAAVPETTPASTPVAVPGPTGTPSLALPEHATPGTVSSANDQVKPAPDARTKTADTKARPPTPASRKAQQAAKRTPPVPAGNCKSPIPSERDASCVFQ